MSRVSICFLFPPAESRLMLSASLSRMSILDLVTLYVIIFNNEPTASILFENVPTKTLTGSKLNKDLSCAPTDIRVGQKSWTNDCGQTELCRAIKAIEFIASTLASATAASSSAKLSLRLPTPRQQELRGHVRRDPVSEEVSEKRIAHLFANHRSHVNCASI